MRKRIPLGRLAIVCAAMLHDGMRSANSDPVELTVDAATPNGTLPRAWSYFGYDEPNFTYSANGRKLLGELAALSPVPVYIRTHNLLTSGDGKGSLKWGSTNAYTEDANGNPVYDWTIVDRSSTPTAMPESGRWSRSDSCPRP